jgi:very-short-patch-repair endonuclease
VDFYCRQAKLVIELDGGGHAESWKIGQDIRRTQELEKLGLRVLRFWNTDVHLNIAAVLERIADAVGPTPITTPPAGERELTHPDPLSKEQGIE